MSDLVERLREEPGQYSTLFVKAMFAEAADEIDRLRKTLREIETSSNDPRAIREARAALGGKP